MVPGHHQALLSVVHNTAAGQTRGYEFKGHHERCAEIVSCQLVPLVVFYTYGLTPGLTQAALGLGPAPRLSQATLGLQLCMQGHM